MMISEYIGEEEVFDETPAAEREFRQTQTLPLRSGSFVKLKLPMRSGSFVKLPARMLL